MVNLVLTSRWFEIGKFETDDLEVIKTSAYFSFNKNGEYVFFFLCQLNYMLPLCDKENYQLMEGAPIFRVGEGWVRSKIL